MSNIASNTLVKYCSLAGSSRTVQVEEIEIMAKRIYPWSVLPPWREKRQRGPSEPLGSTPNKSLCAVHPLIAASCFAGVQAAPWREKKQVNSCESACGTQQSGSASFDSCSLGLCLCQVSMADMSCLVMVLKIVAVHPLIAAV